MNAQRWGLVLLISASAVGCSLRTPAFAPATPAEAPELAQRVQADPSDLDAIVSLAVLLLDEGNAEDAFDLLSEADRANPGDPAIPLLRSLAAERRGRYSEARDGYVAYGASRGGALARIAAGRARVIESAARREDVQRLLLQGAPPLPAAEGRVAVLPFARSSSAPGEAADAAAVSEFIGRDAALAGWEVVDGSLVRILLEELGVPPPSLADLAVGVEVGRRLGADRVVQGQMRQVSATRVEWSVTVTTLAGTESLFVRQTTVVGPPSSRIALQRRLSPMVVADLAGRPQDESSAAPYVQNAVALRAFGEALLAVDRGDVASANAAYVRALEADPAFVVAGENLVATQVILDSPSADAVLHDVARIGGLQRAVLALGAAQGGLNQEALARVGARDRALLTDVLGLDRLSGGTAVDLVFTLPGGGP